MNIIDAMQWRYAVRQFSSAKLDQQQVQDLLTATILSATSYGLQPYRLILLDDIDVRRALLPYAYGQDKVVNCSHLLVFAAQTDIGDAMINKYIDSVACSRNIPVAELQGYAEHIRSVFRDMNEQQKRKWAHQQVHIALGTLLAAAATMTIDACPMGGIEASEFDRVLKLNERGLETSIICALGIRHADDAHAQLEKVRYSYEEMVSIVQPFSDAESFEYTA